MHAWLMLLAAGALEIVWAIGLKYTRGFSAPAPSAITIAAIAASLYLLARAAQSLPIGTAYAIWTGIGAVGVAIVGIVAFEESANLARLACIALIVAGVVGLKLTAPI